MHKLSGKIILLSLLASLGLILGACSNSDDEAQPNNEETENTNQEATMNEEEKNTENML